MQLKATGHTGGLLFKCTQDLLPVYLDIASVDHALDLVDHLASSNRLHERKRKGLEIPEIKE